MQGLARVGHDAERDVGVDADDVGVDVDVDDGRAGRGQLVVAGGDRREARAERQHHVRLAQPRRDERRRPDPQAAEVERVVVREGVVAPERGDHRDGGRLGEGDQVGHGARGLHAAADQQHRTPRARQQLQRARDVGGGRRGPRGDRGGAEMPRLERYQREGRAGGLEIELIDGNGLRRRFPWLGPDVCGATWSKRDGPVVNASISNPHSGPVPVLSCASSTPAHVGPLPNLFACA